MSVFLAVETSTAACSVAVDVNGTVSEFHQIKPRMHASLLLPWINELLQASNITLDDLDAIAFGCGPGGFTGVRIGVGVVQGLALGAGLEVIPISSLQALAQQAYDDQGFENTLVIQDAKMGEVYWGAFELGAEGLMERVVPDQLCPLGQINPPDSREWIRLGDMTDCKEYYPSARAVLKLAQPVFMREGAIDLSQALPVYLRGAQAWRLKDSSPSAEASD